MTLRSYSELSRLQTLEERYHYLSLRGSVGASTFGFDRWINQKFYRSSEWRHIRHHVLARDEGMDLGIPGFGIHSKPHIHHMNPMKVRDILDSDMSILDPEYLITCSLRTHNAIHFGTALQLPGQLVERRPGDTKLW